MTNKVFVTFNGLTNRYETVFDSPTELSAKVRFKNVMGKSPDYDNLEVCVVGEVDVETGVLTAFAAPKRIDKLEINNKPILSNAEEGTN